MPSSPRRSSIPKKTPSSRASSNDKSDSDTELGTTWDTNLGPTLVMFLEDASEQLYRDVRGSQQLFEKSTMSYKGTTIVENQQHLADIHGSAQSE